MATRKAASTTKAPAKKPAAKKPETKVRTVSASASRSKAATKPVKKPVARTVAAPAPVPARPVAASRPRRNLFPSNIVNIVFAELVGTMFLTIATMVAFKENNPLYIGLVYAGLAAALGAVSGAHLNPAVTLGLVVVRKVRLILWPFYWLAQILGAMLAYIVFNMVTNGSLHPNYTDHFLKFDWGLFGVELVGAAVFLFILTAVYSRVSLGAAGRALGAGLALIAGLVVSTSLFATVQASIDTSKIASLDAIPHALRVKGPTLSPTTALVSTEQQNSYWTQSPDKKEKQYSRFGVEVIAATLLGAVIGSGLYWLVAGARRND